MLSAPRRRFLRTWSGLSVFGLAGCASLSNSDPSADQPREYDHLTETTVYLADDVGLRLPEDATSVAEPEDAELLVLHGNLAVPPERVVAWLTEDRVVALLGDRAQQSWLEVVRSDAYSEAFAAEGYSVGEPAPHLLVGVAVEDRTTTYRKSWGNQPTNEDLLAALDETLADIRTRKPDENE